MVNHIEGLFPEAKMPPPDSVPLFQEDLLTQPDSPDLSEKPEGKDEELPDSPHLPEKPEGKGGSLDLDVPEKPEGKTGEEKPVATPCRASRLPAPSPSELPELVETQSQASAVATSTLASGETTSPEILSTASPKEPALANAASESHPKEIVSPQIAVPNADDANAERPVPGKLRISEAAINARMRRIMEPSNKTGQRKVSDAVLKQWQCKKSRGGLQKLFQTCGYDPDRVLFFLPLKS